MAIFFEAYSWINIRFLLEGILVTLQVAGISIIISFLLGSLLGIICYSNVPILSRVVQYFVDIIRNLPLLVIIFFTYFGLPQIGIRFDVFWAAIVALSVFEAAMIAEIVRSGLNAVSTGQMEAARSTGLSYIQSMWFIIVPQALKKMVPSLVSQFIALIKDTSLAVIINLPEFTRKARIIYGQNGNYVIPMFVFMTLIYFLICYGLSLVSKRLEQKAV